MFSQGLGALYQLVDEHLNLVPSLFGTLQFCPEKVSSTMIALHVQELIQVYFNVVVVIRAGKESLELLVHPHFNTQPLLDEAHLVRTVLGCQVLFLAVLKLLLVASFEVDVQ